MTGSELKQLREDLGQAIGRSLSAADMAKLCGLAPGNGPDTIRRWEVRGPSGPAGELKRASPTCVERLRTAGRGAAIGSLRLCNGALPQRGPFMRRQTRENLPLPLAEPSTHPA